MIDKHAQKTLTELNKQIQLARKRREDDSCDGRADPQEIPSDLVEAIAIVLAKKTFSL